MVGAFTTPDASAPDKEITSQGDITAPQRTVRLILKSVPPGAKVFGPDGKQMWKGVTPLEISMPASSKEMTLTFKRSGYRAARHQLLPDQDRVIKVPLKRRYSGSLPDDPKGWGER